MLKILKIAFRFFKISFSPAKMICIWKAQGDLSKNLAYYLYIVIFPTHFELFEGKNFFVKSCYSWSRANLWYPCSFECLGELLIDH